MIKFLPTVSALCIGGSRVYGPEGAHITSDLGKAKELLTYLEANELSLEDIDLQMGALFYHDL